jgi:hypothetical protein
MASKQGPLWTNTWWGKRTTIVNVSIVGVLLLLMFWTALIP